MQLWVVIWLILATTSFAQERDEKLAAWAEATWAEVHENPEALFLNVPPHWEPVKSCLEGIVASVCDGDRPSRQSEIDFARAVLKVLPVVDEREEVARRQLMESLERQPRSHDRDEVLEAVKHEWLGVKIWMYRMSAARRLVDSQRALYTGGRLPLDLTIDSEKRLLAAKVSFARAAFAVFPLPDNNRSNHTKELVLAFIETGAAREHREAAVVLWKETYERFQSGASTVSEEVDARDHVYEAEGNIHRLEAKMARFFAKSDASQ